MAYEFDGVNDNIKSASNAIGTVSNAQTFACWAWCDVVGNMAIFGAAQASGTDAQNLIRAFDNASALSFGFMIDGTTDGLWRTDNTFSTGAWHHVAVTHSAANNEAVDPIIYVNGVSEAFTETSTPATSTAARDTWVAGERPAGSLDFDGRLAEAAIWDRVLSAGEIAGLAKGYSPDWYPRSLRSYTPLRNAGDLACLRTGAALTVTGATVVAHPRIIYPPRGHGYQVVDAAPAGGQPTRKRFGGVPYMGGLRQSHGVRVW